MFFLTLCLLFIIRLRFPTGKFIAEISYIELHLLYLPVASLVPEKDLPAF